MVFDLDGTLVDSRADLVTSVAHMLEALGHPGRSREEISGFIGRGVAHLIRQSLPEGAREPAEVERAIGIFRAHYAAHLADHTRAFEGIPEALGTLSARAPLAVLTNKPGDLARSLLEQIGLAPRFEVVLGDGDVPARKPDPAGLVHACHRLGALPGDTWYVGDLPLDVETGRGAGCRVTVVTWGLGDRAALEAAKPDRVLERPSALAELLDLVEPIDEPDA